MLVREVARESERERERERERVRVRGLQGLRPGPTVLPHPQFHTDCSKTDRAVARERRDCEGTLTSQTACKQASESKGLRASQEGYSACHISPC